MITLLFLSFCALSLGGQIRSYDVVIAPNNKNTPSQFTIPFELDTTISASDYLRIIFPFQVNSITDAYWDVYSSCATLAPTKGASVDVSTVASDPNAFFVSFFTDTTLTTRTGLEANISYYLTFKGTIDSAATVGIQVPIQVLTVSNNEGNWIIYDSNYAFSVVYVAGTFPTTMTTTFTIPASQTNKNMLGADHNVTIDFTPTITLNNRARIDIETTNPSFSILSCTNISSNFAGILSLPSTYQAISPNKVRITIPQTLYAGNGVKYRYQCTIRNPLVAATSGIKVTNWYGYADTITESGTQVSGLQAAASVGTTVTWDETKHKILLGWGYEASSPTAIDAFAIYRDASTTEKWYQSVMTVFHPALDLSTTLKLQVVVTTINDAGFSILKSSIHHNLPDFSSSEKVTCTNEAGLLTCTNVGQLQAKSYFISFRFNLAATTTVTTAATFGQVKVETQEGIPVTLISQSQTSLTNKAILVNPALFHSSGSDGRIAQSKVISTNTDKDYVANGNNIDLKFTFKYFSSNWVPISSTSAIIDRGIEFYTSYSLEPLSLTPTCSIDTLTSTYITISDCSIATTANSFTRLRFRIGKFNDNTGPVATLFTATPNQGTIRFTPVLFSSNQFSSLSIVNQDVFDYYVRWVEGFAATSPTITTATGSTPFFFNSLVYTDGALSSLKVGLSFFYTGSSASDAANDGSYFPTLLRVTGELAPSEQSGADRLLVFFNDLEPIDTENPCFGPAGVTCKYIDGGLSNTITPKLTDYSGSRRIEISTDLTKKFNIYIPVATVSGKKDIGYFVATASVINTTASAQGKFATRHSALYPTWTGTKLTTGSSPPISAAGSPKLTIPASTAMGAVVSTTAGSFTSPTANSGANVGAGYGYCANYNFASDPDFALEPFYAGGTPSEDQNCVKISYSVSSKNVYCYICPVHSTMTSSISATKFKMPTDGGVDFYNLVALTSQNTGDLLVAIYDQQAGVLTALNLDSHSLTFHPDYIRKNSKNVLTTFKFTPAHSIPGTMRIHILPQSGSLNIAPNTNYPCSCSTVTLTSCTISGSDTDIQIDLVASDPYFHATEHIINFMVDSTDPAIGADSTISYKATFSVFAIDTNIPALHHDSDYVEYTMLAQAPQPFVLDNMAYLFGNQKARTTLSFSFKIPSDMMVYPEQSLQFDLGGIVNENSGVTPLCFVRTEDNYTIAPDFFSCKVSPLNAVVLKPNKPINGTYVLNFEYIKAHDATTTDIVGKIVGVDGSTIIVASEGLPLSPIATASEFPSGNVVIARTYSNPGTVGELSITITPSISNITETSHIYAYFPSYYSGNLGYSTPTCTGNGLPITCFLISQRVMRFTNFPDTIPVGEPYTILIYGIVTPVVPTTPGKIFIAYDSDDDPYTLIEQIEVNDVPSIGTSPALLAINSYTVSSVNVRQKADHKFSFKTDSNGIPAGRIITFDYPQNYGPAFIGAKAPKVDIKKVGSSVVTTVQTSAIGSRLKMILPLSLQPMSTYEFTIKNIDNSEYALCNMDNPTITITDTDENTAIFRTAVNSWDSDRIDYIVDPSLRDLRFTDALGKVIEEVLVPIGIYSKEIRIAPPANEEFANDIIFSISYPQVVIDPPILRARAGDSYLSFRIAAASTNYPSAILLDFVKTESVSTQVYSDLPKLKVLMAAIPTYIPTPPITIMQGGTSLPYQWNFAELDLKPHTEVMLTATIEAPSSDVLSIIGASTIVFTPSSPLQGFTFKLSDTADPLNPPYFTLTISGTDAKNYAIANNTITVEVITAASGAPSITDSNIPEDYDPTSQLFILTLDQLAVVYWHVALNKQLTTQDCLRIRSNVNDNVQYDPLSDNQAQYGVMFAYTADTPTSFTVENLLAGTTYAYVLCPIGQIDSFATPTTGTFTTQSNGATVTKFSIHFSKTIPRSQVAPFVCLLMTELQLPNEK